MAGTMSPALSKVNEECRVLPNPHRYGLSAVICNIRTYLVLREGSYHEHLDPVLLTVHTRMVVAASATCHSLGRRAGNMGASSCCQQKLPEIHHPADDSYQTMS